MGALSGRSHACRAETAATTGDAALDALAARARADLEALSYPSARWVTPARRPDGAPIHAALIVGGGQSGLMTAAALRRDGVDDVVLLDRAPAGQEGVWDSFARMEELRTPKGLNGIEFGCPSLSVAAWYAARYGAGAWDALQRIPRRDWAAYLRWYRDTLGLAVESGTAVIDIRPAPDDADVVVVAAMQGGREVLHYARNVVIATGFDGAGGWDVPEFVSAALPRDRYDHTNGFIDFARLRGKRIAILGHGASAFDNANAALAAGAARVDLCFRRERLPRANPHRHLENAGMLAHFPDLDCATRWRVARHVRRVDQPPAPRGFAMAMANPDFHLHPGSPWLSVRLAGDAIAVETPRGTLACDHLLCATGVAVDLAARPELRSLAPVIARWADRYRPEPGEEDERFAAYPFLATDFSFTPREAADAWVTRVFCFNGASAVSHGPHTASISGHRHALPRVVRGITQRLFVLQAGAFLPALQAYAEAELDLPEDFEIRHRAVLPALVSEEVSHEHD